MAARLRAFAVLAGLFVGGVDCARAGAQTPPASAPQADQAEEPESDPPAALAPALPPVAMPVPAPAAAVQPAPAPAAASLSARGPTPRPAIHQVKAHYAGPIATLPGFEMLPEGGSRLFVEISQSVGVEEKKTQRTLTYVLKGTHVVRRNNENALVTVHFNTPVARARLRPSGRDLLFSVDLRADAAPTWKIVNESDGTATLQIDFPKGTFIPVGDVDDSAHPTETPPHPAAQPHTPRAKSRPGERGQPPGVAPANPPPAGN